MKTMAKQTGLSPCLKEATTSWSRRKIICWLREKAGFATLLMSAVVESAASLRMRRHIAIGTTLSLKKSQRTLWASWLQHLRFIAWPGSESLQFQSFLKTKTVIKAWNYGQDFYSYSSLLSSSLLTLEVQQHNVLPRLNVKACAITV